jgi:hypothetical protein
MDKRSLDDCIYRSLHLLTSETNNRLGDLVASARQKRNKHTITLRLMLPDATIKSCKELRDQFYHAKEGILQFTNPDMFTVVIAKTSLSDMEVKKVEEILAEFQENLPPDIKIGETDCMEGDKVHRKI